MDIASAPTDVTAFVGRWRVHGFDGAAITPELKESVGIGDVFVVMPVEGTERHAIAMRAPPDAGGAARADSAAASRLLRLLPRLRSTFAPPTSAEPHFLLGSKRTKNG